MIAASRRISRGSQSFHSFPHHLLNAGCGHHTYMPDRRYWAILVERKTSSICLCKTDGISVPSCHATHGSLLMKTRKRDQNTNPQQVTPKYGWSLCQRSVEAIHRTIYGHYTLSCILSAYHFSSTARARVRPNSDDDGNPGYGGPFYYLEEAT
jgi:hypothetical protein